MKKILVIDDEPIVRTSCEKVLVPDGYEVKTVENGQKGIETLEREQFNLILLDLKMPVIDGVEVLKIIKERWPETRVIILTGYSTVETAVKTLRLGAFNFIEKPFAPDKLLSAVKEAIKD
jgi:DNA-binding NtrC family response regulator